MNRTRRLGAVTLVAAALPALAPAAARACPGVVNYSPWHLPGQDPGSGRGAPTDAQIAADLLLIWRYTDEIRTYAVDAVGQSVIRACQRDGMRVNVGSFLAREQVGTDPSLQGQPLNVAQNQALNAQTIASQIAVGNLGYDVVQSLIVGNELILWDNMSIPQLHAYIAQVRDATGARYPVTTGETWNVGYQAHPELADGLDFVLFHGHPYWEGAGIDVAVSQSLAHAWDVMRALYPGRRLVQGETGWPTGGGSYENATYDYAGVAVPSVANQARFIRDLDAAIGANGAAGKPMEVWLFEAFDEPWKGAEGTVGGSWGFLDGAGAPKHDALAARLVPLSATESRPGTAVITLDHAATGAAAAQLGDPAAWEVSGGTVTGVTLSADGATVTVTYTGGDAFKAVRASAAACDVIAGRRFVLGDPAAHPVPASAARDAGAGGGGEGTGTGTGTGMGTGTGTDAGTGTGSGSGSIGRPGDRASVGCACSTGGAGGGGGVALAAIILRARRRGRRESGDARH